MTDRHHGRTRLATVGQRPAVPATAFADVVDGTLTAGECGSCAAPSPGAYLCETCRDTIATELARIPDVVDDLNVTRFGLRGIDYTTRGGGSGAPTKHQPLPIASHAVEARTNLRKNLRHLVETCLQLQVDHTSPHRTIPPRGDIPAMAEWLRWRVDGMAAHPHFTDTPTSLRSAVGHAAFVAMPAAARRAIGPCPEWEITGCTGTVFTTPGATVGHCSACGAMADTTDQIDIAVAEVRHYRLPAADIARLATYLGFDLPRETIASRIRLWSHRGTITRLVDLERGATAPVYELGPVWDLLRDLDRHPRHSWSPWSPSPDPTDPNAAHLTRRCTWETETGETCSAYETKRNRDHDHGWTPWHPDPAATVFGRGEPARLVRRCTSTGCDAHRSRPNPAYRPPVRGPQPA